MTAPLLDDGGLDRLRSALDGYTVDAVGELLGPVGRSALDRGDLDGARNALGRTDHPPATLLRLFVLGAVVPEQAARRALGRLDLEQAAAAGLVRASGGEVRALLDLRPYAEHPADPAQEPWWVVSDPGSDVGGGPLAADHVLGVGSASLTLAQSTPRRPVDRALDIGTGCGVQALHLARHAAHVTATDISWRALRLAATTAALSGQAWDLRQGSLLEPAAGERFDLVVANPPFVVSDGGGDYDYRDSGVAGDRLCSDLVRGLPGVLTEEGTGQLLANWIVPADGSAEQRLHSWFDGSGCDAWVWQREIAEPGEYVSLWLRDAGLRAGTAQYSARYDSWLAWFRAAGVVAVGMGLITMWRAGSAAPTVVIEDVPQAVERPCGAHIEQWLRRRRFLAQLDDAALVDTTLTAAPDLVLQRPALLGADGWATATTQLRQSHAMRWTIDTDDAIAALVAGCDGRTPLSAALAVLAGALGTEIERVTQAALPVVRDLVARGFLLPASGGPDEHSKSTEQGRHARPGCRSGR